MKLELKNGCFTYPKGKCEIFRDVHAEVESGQLCAILGPNGAGKTTLLRCMTGMLTLGSGDCYIDGESVRAIPSRKLWQKVAYVPQARGVQTSNTAIETVLLGRASRFGMFSQPGKVDFDKAYDALERLNVLPLADKRCDEMSGGELQMVLIAKALASEPELLVLDEPESNLDFRNQLLIMNVLSSLKSEGIACIFNTHYPAHALRRADKALLMSMDGTSVFGGVDAVLTESNIERAFGVKVMISSVETPQNILSDIIPLRDLSSDSSISTNDYDNERSLASITVISPSDGFADTVNALFHEYGGYIVGRMGMPYRDGGVYIITVNLDAPANVIKTLSHRLGVIPNISVKTTFAYNYGHN